MRSRINVGSFFYKRGVLPYPATEVGVSVYILINIHCGRYYRADKG